MNHPTYRLLASLVEVCRSQVDPDVYADLSGQLTQVRIALSRSPDDGYIYALADGFLAMAEHLSGRQVDRVGSTPGQAHLASALKALQELPRPSEPPPPPEPRVCRYRAEVREGSGAYEGAAVEVGSSSPEFAVQLTHILGEALQKEGVQTVGWGPSWVRRDSEEPEEEP